MEDEMIRTSIGVAFVALLLAVPASHDAAGQTLDYPPCSKTVKDQCIQLWQKNLVKAYPECAKVKGATNKAACIETAYKKQGG
jgi:hypothetical protein